MLAHAESAQWVLVPEQINLVTAALTFEQCLTSYSLIHYISKHIQEFLPGVTLEFPGSATYCCCCSWPSPVLKLGSFKHWKYLLLILAVFGLAICHICLCFISFRSVACVSNITPLWMPSRSSGSTWTCVRRRLAVLNWPSSILHGCPNSKVYISPSLNNHHAVTSGVP